MGVIGIGGLGHFALQFLNKWGCEVTAFTSTEAKRDEAKQMGAHHTVNSRNAAGLRAVKGSFDFILSTVNVDSGTPLGSPATTRKMLEFCARHGIEAVTEHFPMSKVNDALEHLKSGKARYRVILENDFE